MSTLTMAEQAKISAFLDTHPLVRGVGTEEAACSVAAMNLALHGGLTDDTPACMSEVIGAWMRCTQDAMSESILHSAAWRDLLPRAAGTGRAHESARLAIVLDWMWECLTEVQPVADVGGYGEAWRTMCERRTRAAADTVLSATAYATANAAAANAAYATAAGDAAYATAAYAARSVTNAARVAYAADDAAYATANAARVAYAAYVDFWRRADPVRLLARLIAVGEVTP